MFTDIVGYTSLMGNNEAHALQILDENRYIHKTVVNKNGGKIVKELGDGMLSIFYKVSDAVNAACEILVTCEKNKFLNLRVGLHCSTVLFENNDIFGHGVNVAARIEPTAPSGGIHISEDVFSKLKSGHGYNIKLAGHFNLKNIEHKVKLYQVLIDDSLKNRLGKSVIPYEERAIEEDQKSIAIMPFKNLTNDEEQEYFCEGVAEDILITLSNIEELKVVGRKSSFQFKNSELSEMQIGEILNVNHILEGTVRRSGNRLRIQVYLYDLTKNSQVWAEKYDRDLIDIFDIQDDIAGNVTQQLKVTLFENSNRSSSVNMEAYELLLKGRYYEEMFLEGFDKALACYKRAIEIDPLYAEAYAALANLNFLFTMHLIHTSYEGFTKVKHYAEKAISLNPEVALAYFTLGNVSLWFDWDFEKAISEFTKAANSKVSFYSSGIAINPWYYAFIEGNYDKAIISALNLYEIDPLSLFNQYQLSCFYTWGSKPEKARKILNNIIKMAPNYSEAYRLLAYNSFLEGDTERATKEANKAVELAYGLGWSQITQAIVLAQSGNKKESMLILEKLENSMSEINISLLGIGLIYTYLEDFDNAFNYLEEAVKKKDQWTISLKYGPEYDPLRSDPRFDRLVNKVGFPEIPKKLHENYN